MKLKTLKEIEPELSFSGKEVKELGLRFTDMPKIEFIQKERDKIIRQEIIKRIKKLKTKLSHMLDKLPDKLAILDDISILGQIKGFMEFFNITGDDLKDGD